MDDRKSKSLTLIKYAGILGGIALALFGIMGLFFGERDYLVMGSIIIAGLVLAAFGYAISSYLAVNEEEKQEQKQIEEEEKAGERI